jgi:hypothetical protein
MVDEDYRRLEVGDIVDVLFSHDVWEYCEVLNVPYDTGDLWKIKMEERIFFLNPQYSNFMGFELFKRHEGFI